MNQPALVAGMPPSAPSRRSRGFTLIELLVVVAIIGILSSLLLASLARSKEQAQGISCQNNARQLMLGCLMYGDDNAGYFPYNMVGTNAQNNVNWANDLLDWETTPDNTNTTLLANDALAPFLAGSFAVYHCPADQALSAIQRSAGWANRVRSYSMNASVGNAGAITQSGVNTNNPSYVQFFKYSSVPKPAQIFVFMEEHPDTIYDGYFLNKAYPAEWIRLPASLHNGSANISFADGHVEVHRWQEADTQAPAVPDGAAAVILTNLPSDQQIDFAWVIAHMTVKSH